MRLSYIAIMLMVSQSLGAVPQASRRSSMKNGAFASHCLPPLFCPPIISLPPDKPFVIDYQGYGDCLIEVQGVPLEQFVSYVTRNFPGGFDHFIELLVEGTVTVTPERLEDLIKTGNLTTKQAVKVLLLGTDDDMQRRCYHLSSSTMAHVLADCVITAYGCQDPCSDRTCPWELLTADINQDGLVIKEPEYILTLEDLELVLDALIPEDINRHDAFRVTSIVKNILLACHLDGLRVYRWNTELERDLESLITIMLIVDRLGIAFCATWWAEWLAGLDIDNSLAVIPSRALLARFCNDQALQSIISQENFGAIIVSWFANLGVQLDVTTAQDQELVACLIAKQRQVNVVPRTAVTRRAFVHQGTQFRFCPSISPSSPSTVLTFCQMARVLSLTRSSIPFTYFYTLVPLLWDAHSSEIGDHLEQIIPIINSILPLLDFSDGTLRDYYRRFMHTGLYQGIKNVLSLVGFLDTDFDKDICSVQANTCYAPLGKTKVLGLEERFDREKLWQEFLPRIEQSNSATYYDDDTLEEAFIKALSCASPFTSSAGKEDDAQLALAFANQQGVVSLGIYPALDGDNGDQWFAGQSTRLRIDPGLVCFEICSPNLLDVTCVPSVWKHNVQGGTNTASVLISIAQQIGMDRFNAILPQLRKCCLSDGTTLGGDSVPLGNSLQDDAVRAQIEGQLLVDGGASGCPQVRIESCCQNRARAVTPDMLCKSDVCLNNPDDVTICSVQTTESCVCIKGWCWLDPAQEMLMFAFAEQANDVQGAQVSLHFSTNIQLFTTDPLVGRWLPATFMTQPCLFVHPTFTVEQFRRANGVLC